jgi:hypothetical protein
MLKVVMEASAEPFNSVPYLIVLVIAAIALVTAVFLVRYRKGDK